MSEKICRCGVDDRYCDYCYRRVVFERDQLRQRIAALVAELTLYKPKQSIETGSTR